VGHLPPLAVRAAKVEQRLDLWLWKLLFQPQWPGTKLMALYSKMSHPNCWRIARGWFTRSFAICMVHKQFRNN